MIYDRVHEEMVSALRAGDTARRSILSYIYAQMKNAAIARRVEKLPDADAIGVLQKLRKQTEETLALVGADHTGKGKAEIAVIEELLPQEPSAADVRRAVADVIAERGFSSLKDMGRVMDEVPKRLPGVNKTTLSAVAREMLVH